MAPIERKRPMDCSKRELEDFLHQNGYSLPECDRDLMMYHHRLIESAEQILRKRDRTFIEFHSTGLKKRLGQLKGLFNQRKNSESSAQSLSPPPEISAPRPSKPTLVEIGFDPEIESRMNNLALSEDSIENYRPSGFPPPPPSMLAAPQVTFAQDNDRELSNLEANRGQDMSMRETSTPYRQPAKRQRQESRIRSHIVTPSNQHKSENYSQFGDKPFRSKFLTKFDEKKTSIESYIAAVDRWRVANEISDDQAMAVALDGFTNLELANHVSTGIMSSGISTFENFCQKLREYLGRSKTQFLDEFDSTKRKSQESPYVFLARLQDLLKLGLELEDLTSEHNELIVRRFLKGLHPKLRGLLEARDEVLTIDTVAKLAWRLETALQIPAGATVETINNIDTNKVVASEKKVSFQPKKCEICGKSSHNTSRCFGNPASRDFDLNRFYSINNHLERPSKN